MKDRLLYFKDHLYIPKGEYQLIIMQDNYDVIVAGHLGFDKMYEAISQYCYWPHMSQEVKDYMCSCDAYQWNKLSQSHVSGLLHPLDIPASNWEQISIDFIVHLPCSKAGYNNIVVFVDHFFIYNGINQSSCTISGIICHCK